MASGASTVSFFLFEVVYAALGPEKQYFLRFRDGDTCWSLWAELSQQIKEQEEKRHRVSLVPGSFSKKLGSFFSSTVLFLKHHGERM